MSLPTPAELRKSFGYDPETGAITWLRDFDRWGRARTGGRAGYLHAATGYMRLRVGARTFPARRVAYAVFHGEWPSGEVDHINGDKVDNRIANLRDVTTSENQFNRRGANKQNKSGLLGVHAARERWRAAIRVEGRLRYLGVFDDPLEAHKTYLEAKAALTGAGTLGVSP